ncbi:MAG: 50S ribosomal protein L18Ae [Candidatus Methanomethylicia archaeon]|nr:50S ribosomal protein L18Ae [Candidatus Methanomethylicia archaeon]MCX8169296.1 50S ribosomal protein L18Ae [Candidatus Methanomethylicia archaeon]MDW7988921.1 50S ribosomal protein L18Ae [Nitrososphaerota archaeon]
MDANIYRVKGEIILRNGDKTTFTIDIPGLKPEHAIERVYSNLSSLHRVKRGNIKIFSIEVISPKIVKNSLLRDLWREIMNE